MKVNILDLPLTRVITERVPAHSHIRVRGTDGVLHDVQVTAYPLYARADRLVGAVAVFWENDYGTRLNGR